MEPLSSLEAAFLGLETPGVEFVYACILELDRELDLDALRALLELSLDAAPRYRQRIVRRWGRRPAWSDDPEFRIARHVHAAHVAPPGGLRELEQLTADLLATELPQQHSPWRLWNVSGLAGGRGAVIAMIHHSLSDGLAGFRLLDHVLGATPAPRATTRPRPALRRLFTRNNLRALVRMLRDGLSPASQIGLNPAHVHRARLVTTHEVPMASLRRVQHGFGATHNDVVLATVAGGLRRFLARRGLDVDRLTDVRAMVPAGMHARTDDATAGNRIALLLAPVPVHIADPRACLGRITGAMRNVKRGGATGGGELLVAAADLFGPRLLTDTLRLALRLRAFNTIVTNVPGPAATRTLLGARLTGLVPIVNLWPHEALGIAVASYAGSVFFGLQADRATVPDLAALRDDLAAAFDALVAAAGSPLPAAAGA
jgi:hypothetical protein